MIQTKGELAEIQYVKEKRIMLTKNEFRSFREDFQKAVEGLEKKYNLSISLGDITYNDEKFTTRLTATDQRKIKTPEDIFHFLFFLSHYKYQVNT